MKFILTFAKTIDMTANKWSKEENYLFPKEERKFGIVALDAIRAAFPDDIINASSVRDTGDAWSILLNDFEVTEEFARSSGLFKENSTAIVLLKNDYYKYAKYVPNKRYSEYMMTREVDWEAMKSDWIAAGMPIIWEDNQDENKCESKESNRW